MTTATTERRIEAICPEWCEGHDGKYQSWETRCDDGRQQRDHASDGFTVANTTAYVAQIEEEDHTLSTPFVELFIDSPDLAILTPSQARDLAQVLAAAADRAEAQR